MVLNEMDDCMNAAVHGSSIVGAVAEVLPERALLVLCNVYRVAYKLIDTLILCR